MSNQQVATRDRYEVAIQEAQASFLEAAQRTGLDWKAESLFALDACAANDNLMKTANGNPFSLRMSLVKVAAIGLSLNPALQHAFLVPRDGRVILDISYRGLIHLAVQTGSILWAKAELVHEKDKFRYRGPGEKSEHECDPFATDRGAVVGAYCIAEIAPGRYLTEVMSAQQIAQARNCSRAYQNGKGPWVTFPEEMTKKVVMKRASKTWPRVHERFLEALQYLNTDAGEGFEHIEGQAQPHRIIEAEAVPEEVRSWVSRVIERATAVQAWQAAEDLVAERLSGTEQIWALQQLKAARPTAEERSHESG